MCFVVCPPYPIKNSACAYAHVVDALDGKHIRIPLHFTIINTISAWFCPLYVMQSTVSLCLTYANTVATTTAACYSTVKMGKKLAQPSLNIPSGTAIKLRLYQCDYQILTHGINFFGDNLFLFKLTLVETKSFTEQILPEYLCSTSENLKLSPQISELISENFALVEATHVFRINN